MPRTRSNTGTNQWVRFRGPCGKIQCQHPSWTRHHHVHASHRSHRPRRSRHQQNIGVGLKGDDGNSDIPTGARVAYLRVDGISDTEFNELDGIIDSGIGTGWQNANCGDRVKYNPTNDRMYIYLAHQ